MCPTLESDGMGYPKETWAILYNFRALHIGKIWPVAVPSKLARLGQN